MTPERVDTLTMAKKQPRQPSLKVVVDAQELRAALKAASVIASFSGGKEEGTTEAFVPCLLTARKKLLIVEAADYGIYLKFKLPADVQKEGEASVSANLLARCAGDSSFLLTVDPKTSTLLVKTKTTKYSIQQIPAAKESVVANRPDLKKNKVTEAITLPFALLKQAVATVSFKPGLREEMLRIQLKVSKTKKEKVFELIGLDSYSFARISATGPDISITASLDAVVKTNLLDNIAKQLLEKDERVTVGVLTDKTGRQHALAFTAKSFVLYYPVLDVPIIDLDKKLAGFLKKAKVTCSFHASREYLLEGVADLVAIKASAASALIKFLVKKNRLVLSSDLSGNKAVTRLHCDNVKVAARADTFYIHEGYLTNFLNLAPPESTLQVESCGKAYVQIKTLGLESSSIEFLVAKALPATQSPE